MGNIWDKISEKIKTRILGPVSPTPTENCAIYEALYNNVVQTEKRRQQTNAVQKQGDLQAE
jgi:hypothetical protein